MKDYIINIKNINFNYDKKEILTNVSVDIEKGKLYALFGPNGSGKSTLLKCIAGLIDYNMGSIKILGEEISKIKKSKLSKLISYVPQESKSSFPFTVEEIVIMGRTPYINSITGPSKRDIELSYDAMKMIGIYDLKDELYTTLSGGQRQLVLIARAIAQDTPIIILDEPTSALDFKNQLLVWKILKNLKTLDKTIICCTHDPNHVSWFCERGVVIEDGKVIRQGNINDIICEDVINTLYGDICRGYNINQMNVIIPNID